MVASLKDDKPVFKLVGLTDKSTSKNSRKKKLMIEYGCCTNELWIKFFYDISDIKI